jgi:S-adenosylmethionine-diacylgycerolhomoserine-N-methlytransferase
MSAATAAEKMDRQYRFQRHIYDYTRTHYLFWRQRLIADLKPRRGGSIVEVACGTGWNLLRAAECYPASPLYGFDISREMLATSRSSIARRGIAGRVVLAEGDATAFDLGQMFGLEKADRIFISYALSMIPDWPATVECAVSQLAAGGQLHIVDFGRMDRMSSLPRAAFLRFLAHYNVTPRRDLEVVLQAAAKRHGLSITFEEMRSGYTAYALLRCHRCP